jgi:hypothetical protein
LLLHALAKRVNVAPRTIELRNIAAQWSRAGQTSSTRAVRALRALGSRTAVVQWEVGFRQNSGARPKLTKTFYGLQHLLLATGVAMTNAVDGRADEAWYAVIRHKRAFVVRGKRLEGGEGLKGLDAHRRAVIADELGMGACLIVMADRFGTICAVDVDQYFAAGRSSFRNHFDLANVVRLRESQLCPDFIMLDRDGAFRIVEAKGTFNAGTRTQQLRKGKLQATAIRIIGRSIPAPFVLSTVFPDRRPHPGRVLPSTMILDPPSKGRFAVHLQAERALRLSLASTMCFLGFGEAARRFANGQRLGNFRRILSTQPIPFKDGKYVPIFGARNGWIYVYDAATAKAILRTDDGTARLSALLRIRTAQGNNPFAVFESDRAMLGMGFGLIKLPRPSRKGSLGIKSRSDGSATIVIAAEGTASARRRSKPARAGGKLILRAIRKEKRSARRTGESGSHGRTG